ncbi:MAG: glycosyl transferase family protein [Candidatus Kaiserbacteria bacterium]|nr:glycosyl transferase family protein [Candidatus Kaiserbacteria bacterium]
MAKEQTYLSVIIPAYNESSRIVETLHEVQTFLDAQKYNSEVIVVDDGSTDKLYDVVLKHAKNMSYLKCIRYRKNRGKGYAVREGMLQAEGIYRLFMDADNSVTIDHVTKFISEAQQGNDIVIGSILIPNKQNAVEKNGLHRKILRVCTRLVRSLFVRLNVTVYDTQRGFKLFTNQAARRIFALQKIERFGFDVELLVLGDKMQFKIKEVSVRWINPEGSKVTLMSYPQSLFELLVIQWNIMTHRYKF